MILPEDILKHLVEVDAALIKALRLVAKHHGKPPHIMNVDRDLSNAASSVCNATHRLG
ncbi:hypothetical protein [Ruegeria sp. AU67]|uniref:hypothetical protein n=1 Tax=Ruegeria sp. AU67 TaxID=2108530 RepID=UPI00135B1BB3|nr:hypothetical protein [Ruegeria sp. AU67]